MSLRDLQQQLAEHILGDGSPRPALTTALALPHGIDPSERLGVYRGGYPARIEEALADVFPALAHVIGPAALCALTKRYIAAVALRSYSLNDAGGALADFLRSDELTEALPFLPDLARLELNVARAFHAFERPPAVTNDCAEWTLEDWTHAVLQFQPSVDIVRSPWPIRAIWEARHTPREQIDIELDGRPDCVLIRRCGLDFDCESLEDGEALALEEMLSGSTLGRAIEAIGAAGHDPSQVSAWFARWMSLGIVAAISLRPSA